MADPLLNSTVFLELGALLLVVVAAWCLGRLLRAAVGAGAKRHRIVSDGAVDVALGLAALHTLLLALDLVDIRWTLGSIGLTVATMIALLAAISHRWSASSSHPDHSSEENSLPWGWGDLTLLAVVTWMFVVAHTGVATTPDFIYQWGIKGHRFYLAQGIDWGFLASPLGHAPSPDYPNLVPNLFALTSLLLGEFTAGAAALWTPILMLMIWGAVRRTCRGAIISKGAGQALIAITALLIGMFATGYRLAGGADLNIACAALLSLAPLLRWRGPGDDLAVGAAAALAVGSKQEGLPLALVLLAVFTLVHRKRLGSASATGRLLYFLRVIAPPLIVATPWLLQVVRYDLLGITHPSGAVRWSEIPTVLSAVAASIQAEEWHGLGWLILLVPLLLISDRTRAVGLVLSLQATAYLAVYLRHPGELVEAYVLINAPRLVFHLVPAALCATVFLMASRRRRAVRYRALTIGLLLVGVAAGWGFVAEQVKALKILNSPEGSGVVARWRMEQERPESLRRYLEDVNETTYPGSTIAFDPDVGSEDQRFYLTLWTAYFLPGKQVIPAVRTDALEVAQYLVTYNHHRGPPDAERVYLHPSGSVFWLGEEGDQETGTEP